MDIKNFDWNVGKVERRNHPLLPQKSIRGIIIAKSGSGKTNLISNLLLREGWLDYDHLFVFGKSLHQPIYKIIQKSLHEGLTKAQILSLFDHQNEFKNIDLNQALEYIGRRNNTPNNIVAQFYENSCDIPDPKVLDDNNKNLIIFDDVMLGKQSKIEDYYTRGRHNNIDCFYLAQNYFKLPRQTIRENSNFIILFPQNSKSMHHIFHDHCSQDMNRKEFEYFYKKTWSKPHNFIVLDLTSSAENGKYRSGFDEFYIPNTLY